MRAARITGGATGRWRARGVGIALLALAATTPAQERPLVPTPQAPPASLQVPPGARLPLDAAFTDSTGRSAPLVDWLGGRPALVVPGYYTCPQLCGLLLQGVLEGLHADRLDRAEPPARVVSVSVDPADTPLTAARRLAVSRAYAAFLDDDGGAARPAAGPAPAPAPDLVFLTGAPGPVRALVTSLGWRYEAQAPTPGDPAAARFAHPAAVFVVDGAGRVRSVLGGLRFAPGTMRAALRGAATPPADADAATPLSVSGAIALLCAHFDPRAGRHSEGVMQLARAVSLAVLLSLVALAWRASRRRGGAPDRHGEPRP